MVIDTDGSAFITKAEFDSLKNNFQAQIDNYNSSIDSKIDGAIASYLAGVKMSTVSEKNPLYRQYNIPTNTNGTLYWSNSTSGSYCGDSTQKAMITGKIYSAGYYCTGSGTSQQLTIKSIGAADISTSDDIRDRVRFDYGGPGFINTIQKCSYVGSWVSCNSLWMGSTYQGILSAEYLGVMSDGGPGSMKSFFGNDRSKKVWRYAQYNARRSDTFGQQYFANLVFSWVYENPTKNYVIQPLNTANDYGDTIGKNIYSSNIVSSTYPDTTVGGIVQWDNQSSVSTSVFIPVSTSSAKDYINFNWPVFNFFDGKSANEEMFASFNNLNSQNIAFKNGLVYEVAERKAHLTVSVKPSQNGKLIFYKSNSGDVNWGGAKTNYSTQSKYNCTANSVYNDEFDVEAGDLIWVVYLPSADGYLSDCLAKYLVES